jgi:hypothetical protein
MEVTALDYNDLPNIPREMRRALFKRYLAKLGGLGMYDPASLEKVQGKLDGFQSWLFLPLSLATKHLQSRLIQQEENMALAAALWFLARDRRIKVESRMIFARWIRMVSGLASCDKKRKERLHMAKMREREIRIHIRHRHDIGS